MKNSSFLARWSLVIVALAAPAARSQSQFFPAPRPAAATASTAPAAVTSLAGKTFTPESVKTYGKEALYDPAVLRTIFLEFERPNWEQQLAANYRSDMEVPAKMTVDGKIYPGVGVSFRGNSSYSMVPYGKKHSLNISVDAADPELRLLGHRSLNFLNANQDPTFLRTFLYHHIARQYIPSPRANFVRVVINGEYHGIFVNTQQINSDLTKDQFGSGKGARWKVSGSPRNAGGLQYRGDDVGNYRYIYEIKSKEDPQAWADLINLTRVLGTTPAAGLEEALKPILDLEGVLKFLALDLALQNSDGYWTKAGEYTLYQDTKGVFHVVPWDVNESFKEPGGRGGNTGGDMLDLYAGSGDPAKALLYHLLQVPALEQRFLGYVRDIAENWMTWEKIGPVVESAQALISADIAIDHRKLYSTEAFTAAVTTDYYNPGNYQPRAPAYSLMGFFRDRRVFLLSYPGVARPAAKKP
jgi:hypothetical protein